MSNLISCGRLLVSHSDRRRKLQVLLLRQVLFDLKGK